MTEKQAMEFLESTMNLSKERNVHIQASFSQIELIALVSDLAIARFGVEKSIHFMFAIKACPSLAALEETLEENRDLLTPFFRMVLISYFKSFYPERC